MTKVSDQDYFWYLFVRKVLILDLLPSFTNTLTNVSVPIERDVTFTCNVKNIGHYRVGVAEH